MLKMLEVSSERVPSVTILHLSYAYDCCVGHSHKEGELYGVGYDVGRLFFMEQE